MTNDVVIEELKRLIFGKRQQPQRQLAHLDCQRIDVNAVQTPLSDEPHGVNLPLTRIDRKS